MERGAGHWFEEVDADAPDGHIAVDGDWTEATTRRAPRKTSAGLARELVLIGDALLRRRLAIVEYSTDPDCIFRIAPARARSETVLADGTRIVPGDMIGTLHLWGAHLPKLERRTPSLAWGAGFRWRMDRSLVELARFIDDTPEWSSIMAIRCDAAFASQFDARRLKVLAAHTPFELVSQRRSGWFRMGELFENCLFAALTWAFNPSMLARQPFSRPRQELWISRRALAKRYLDPNGNTARRRR